jgi:hypothetical protein
VSEEAEALGTVSGWITREIVAATIVAPFMVMVAKSDGTPKEKSEAVKQQMISALDWADTLIDLAKKNPPGTIVTK